MAMQSYAKLLSVLCTLEREHGLTSLDAGERAVFDFIVGAVAHGGTPSTDDILAANIGSRASVYRWLNLLREAKLIATEVRNGQSCYTLDPRLEGFSANLLQKIKRSI